MNEESLDLRQMEAFAAVISSGSITGAARVLGRSQPVVTRLIQDLEADLGFDLFHRNGPRISPTARGVLFHAEVERTMSGLRHLRSRASAIALGETRSIEIAATPALAAGIVPMALARLEGRLPRHLQLRSIAPEQVVQSVLARTADIGVSSLPIDHPGVDVHWIVEAPCVAVVAANDPLASQDTIRIADIAGRRLVTVGNPYRLRRRFDQAMAQAGVVPSGIIETNASLNALLAARVGLGVALVEPATAYGIPVDGVVMRRLDVAIPSFWGLVTPLAMPLSSDVVAMMDAIRDAAMEMPGARLHDPVKRDSLLDGLYGPDVQKPEPLAEPGETQEQDR